MSIAGILVAGGSGERMGGMSAPKPLLQLAGKPLFLHGLELLSAHPSITVVVLVMGADFIDRGRILIPDRLLSNRLTIVPGGAERQDSCRLGLEAAARFAPDAVLIHDSARPLATTALLDRLTASVGEIGAVPAILPRDSLLEEEAGLVARYLDRGRIRLVQTPQRFPYAPIVAAHRRAAERGEIYTDDASLFLAAGHRVAIIEGERENLKITFPEDLPLAEAILGRRSRA